MNLTLELDLQSAEAVALFAWATNAGMFPANEATAPMAVVDDSDPRELVLKLQGVDPESLLGLRRMLIASRSPVPESLGALAVRRSDQALEERLRADLHDQVAVDRVGELSGEAFFMSVQGLSSSSLYESMQPVVAIWKQLLALQAFPYDVDEAGPSSTDGIELYEISDSEVEVATQSYGGEEEGIAALIHGATSRLRCAGLSFHIECWSA